MNVLQALCAAIRCIPIPPRNRWNLGVGNGAAAAATGTGTATGRGGNGAVGTRNISGLLREGNGATGNTAAATTAYGSRTISGLRGTVVGAGNAAAAANPPRLEPNESLVLSTTDIKVSSKTQSVANRKTVHGGIDDKKEQRMHNVSDTESLAIVSQHTASTTANGQEEKTEIEEIMTFGDEEVGILDPVAECNRE